MAIMSTVRLVVCGRPKVGKSALTVRYLTRRFIGEYTSTTDMLYQYETDFEGVDIKVELLDCTRLKKDECLPLERQVGCGDAFLVVYSVCDRDTFTSLPDVITYVKDMKSPSYIPILLLGNKKDLDHRRQVSLAEGREMALQYGCMFHETSAAEGSLGVKHAFEDLLREAKSTINQRSLKKIRRRNSWKTLSKALGSIFGRVSKSDSPTKITVTALS